MSTDSKTGLQLRSLIKKNGELEISLVNIPIAEPSADEVVVRVEASPIIRFLRARPKPDSSRKPRSCAIRVVRAANAP